MLVRELKAILDECAGDLEIVFEHTEEEGVEGEFFGIDLVDLGFEHHVVLVSIGDEDDDS